MKNSKNSIIKGITLLLAMLSFALFLNACEKTDYQHPLYRNSQQNK